MSGLVGNEMDDATARKVANERAAFFVDKKVVKARVRCIAGMSALVLEFDSGDVVEFGRTGFHVVRRGLALGQPDQLAEGKKEAKE